MSAEKLSQREKRRQKNNGGKRGARKLQSQLTVAERRLQAFELKVDGFNLREIAAKLGVGITTISVDLNAVREELAESALELAAKEREYSLQRLGIAIKALMPRVRRGEDDAILSLDRMEKNRRAILGLDAPTRVQNELSGSVSLDDLEELKKAQRANGCSPPPTSPDPASSATPKPSGDSGQNS